MPCTLLLVEDHAASRRMMARALRMSNHNVHEAETGEAAIQLLSNECFTVVISDLRLPGRISGLDVLRRQREMSAASKLLLVTSYGSVELREQAEALGASYMEKPISMERLLSFIAA